MPRSTTSKSELDTPTKNTTQGKYWASPEAGWGGFINVRINDKQRDDFHSWEAANAAHIGAYYEDHLNEGIKFSAVYDRENECYVVSYTGALVGISSDRFSVTSRAGTLSQALALAVYKHVVLAEGDYIRFGSGGKEFLKFG